MIEILKLVWLFTEAQKTNLPSLAPAKLKNIKVGLVIKSLKEAGKSDKLDPKSTRAASLSSNF